MTHRLDLIGAILTPVLSGGILFAQADAAVASGDVSLSASELTIIGILLSAMVTALVFVHRLLMQAQKEAMVAQQAAHKDMVGVLQQRIDALVGQVRDTTALADQALANQREAISKLVDHSGQQTQAIEMLRERVHALASPLNAVALAAQLEERRAKRHDAE